MNHVRFVLLALLGAASSIERCHADALPDGGHADDALWSGHWEGGIQERFDGTASFLVEGVQVDVARVDGRWSGSVFVPSWGDGRWPLTDFTVKQAGTPFPALTVRFKLRGARSGVGVFDGTATRSEVVGTYTWEGREYPFRLTRDMVPLAHRPQPQQMPRGPFPYAVEEVSFKSGDVRIAGQLTVPEGAASSPAVLLLYGSGAQRCDPEIPGGPIPDAWQWIVADRLTRSGIAVLRVDDRGIGGSTGQYDQSTLAELAEDAIAGTQFLREKKALKGRQIGIVGFSEGALVASIAASKSKSVSFLCLLGAPGGPGDTVQLEGLRAKFDRYFDTDDPDRAARAKRTFEARYSATRRMYEILKSDRSTGEVRDELYRIWSADAEKSLFPSDFEQFAAGLTPLIVRSRLSCDPTAALRAASVPVLAIAGGDDVTVPARANLARIEEALHGSRSPEVVVKLLPGLGHSFHRTNAADDSQVIDDGMLDVLLQWISKHGSPLP